MGFVDSFTTCFMMSVISLESKSLENDVESYSRNVVVAMFETLQNAIKEKSNDLTYGPSFF